MPSAGHFRAPRCPTLGMEGTMPGRSGANFDGLVSYRTQFEYLYDVLAAAPKDVGVIVTEHPSDEPVLRRSGPNSILDALRRTFPNIIFLDEFRRYQSSSQFLVPRVDGVWSVSSSVGYQTLLFNCVLGSPPST